MNVVSASILLLSLAVATRAATPPAPHAVPQKTVITSEHFDMKSVGNETRSVFDGTPEKPVTLTGTNLRIVCDHLEVIAVGVGDSDATVPTLEKFKYLLATGRVNIRQMARAGIVLNVLAIVVITAVGYWVAPLVLGFEVR